MELTNPARVVPNVVALLVLTALTVLSLWSIAPPSPLPVDAPERDFSAGRAFTHVERIAARVHPAGSDAAADVRAYVQATLRGLGLQPQVQDAVGTTDAPGENSLARVRNVVAVLPGTDSTGRVFLVAHYDSVQVSVGANDDGAGVATLLETARALSREDRPRNDVVFVFTDAEEACLCGAEAFVSQHPLAADGGVVLNVESRGSSGPAIMFETSPGNAGVVGVYGDAVAHPVATSFAVEVYRILPNDTDFTPFLESGRFTGLNTAYIDGSAAYHTPQDSPAYVDKASLQHHGSNALALARAFAAADLRELSRPHAHDSTYFPVLTVLVRYPGWLVWPLAALALLAVALLAVVATRRAATGWTRIAAGFGLALIPLIVAPIAAQLLWLALVALRPPYAGMIDPWQPQWYRAAVLALVATVLLAWYGLLRRRIGLWGLSIGALAWLAILGLLLAAVTPGGSYLAAVPALAVALGALAALVLRRRPARIAALTASGGVAVLVLAPTVLLFFPALGLATGGAAAAFAVLLGLALLPVLEWLYPDGPQHRRVWSITPAATAGVLAVVMLATGLAVDRFDAVHPAPTHLMYVLDTDTGQAKWASLESTPSEWTSRYVTGREDLSTLFPILEEDLATGPAPVASLAAPTLSVGSDSVTGGQRVVTLTVTPSRPVRFAFLHIDSEPGSPGPVLRATVAGRDIAVPSDAAFGVQLHAPGAQGVTMTLVLRQTGPVRVRVMDGSDGLTGLPGFTPRPPGVGVIGSHSSELVLVARTYTV